MKRYVKEFIADRRKEIVGKDGITAYDEMTQKVLDGYRRGIITAVEAVRMVASVDTWELNHNEWKNRFNY